MLQQMSIPKNPNITALYYEIGQIFSVRMKKTKKRRRLVRGGL
jgi:hypothetical protein